MAKKATQLRPGSSAIDSSSILARRIESAFASWERAAQSDLSPKKRELLSARELDVLRWLALGKSGGEVAMILDIKVCTVRVHIRNIIRKLDASNIPHAIARAFRAGIL